MVRSPQGGATFDNNTPEIVYDYTDGTVTVASSARGPGSVSQSDVHVFSRSGFNAMSSKMRRPGSGRVIHSLDEQELTAPMAQPKRPFDPSGGILFRNARALGSSSKKGSEGKSKNSKGKGGSSKSKSKGSKSKSKNSKDKSKEGSKGSKENKSLSHSGTNVYCPFPEEEFGSFLISSEGSGEKEVYLSATHQDCQGFSFICSSDAEGVSLFKVSQSKKDKGKKKLRRNLKGRKRQELFKRLKKTNRIQKRGKKRRGSSKKKKGNSISSRNVLLPDDYPSCHTPTPAPQTGPVPPPTPLGNTGRPCLNMGDDFPCKVNGGNGMCKSANCIACTLAKDKKFCNPSECTAQEQQPNIEVDVSEVEGDIRLVTHFLNKNEPQVDAIYAVQDYQTGSLETPPGFSTSFSTDNGVTYRDVEPLGGITHLRVQGVLPPTSGVSLKLPAPVAESVSQVGGGGDGLAPLILGRRVYYMNHHQSNTPLRCTLMNKQPAGLTTNCPNFPYSPQVDLGRNYYSGNGAVGYADRINNRIYIPINPDNSFDKVAVLCVHIPNNSGVPELCPKTGQNATKDGEITFTLDGLIEFQTPRGGSSSRDVGFGFADQSTDRLYFSHIFQRKMYCLSVENPNMPKPCKKNFPIDLSDTVTTGQPIRMTVMPKTDRFIMKAVNLTGSLALQCWENPLDPLIDAKECSGWATQTVTLENGSLYQYEAIPIPNGQGIAIGFCVWPNSFSDTALPTCFHLDSGQVATQGVLADAPQELWNNRPGATADYNLQDARYSALSFYETRVYFHMGAFSSDSFGCYDGSTGMKCANYGYQYTTWLKTYGVMVDVGSNGECVWAMGDRGTLVSFSADDPSQECGSLTPTVEFAANEAYCDPGSSPAQWSSVELLEASSNNGDFENATLTIIGTDGAVVLPGTPIDQGVIVDISSLPVAGTTSTLRFQVQLNGPADGIYERANPPRISVKWDGPPPQVCFLSGDISEIESENLDVCYDDVPFEYQGVDCSLPTCPYEE